MTFGPSRRRGLEFPNLGFDYARMRGVAMIRATAQDDFTDNIAP
jgi:hypothetical protein